ncbi:MAG: glutamate dehydrogenase, partial [Acidobacteriota bacterium]
VSYFEWVQGLQSFFWDENDVNLRLERAMVRAYHEVSDQAKANGDIDFRLAAFMLAVNRVYTAYKLRGIYP